MASGGARNRSGPAVDPSSGRSDRRGLSFKSLPADGYAGEAPAFPLPSASDREIEVWASLWRTPQAFAWASQEWRWQAIGELVRLQVRAEANDSPTTLFERIRQWRADLGLTPAGLKENGWAIAADEVSEKRDDRSRGDEDAPLAPVRRLRA